MKYDIANPYAASYVILRNGEKVAFVLRSNTDWMNDHYGLIAGKVEKGETFIKAAIREAKEEAGIDIKMEDLKHLLTMHRYGSETTWVDVFFEPVKWKGEPYNAEPAQHSELKWMDPEELPDNVVPNVRVALEAIKAGKMYVEYGWEK